MIFATGSSYPEGPGALVSLSRSWMVASCDAELCVERFWANIESDAVRRIAKPAEENRTRCFNMPWASHTRGLYASCRLQVTFLGKYSRQLYRWNRLHSCVSVNTRGKDQFIARICAR